MSVARAVEREAHALEVLLSLTERLTEDIDLEAALESVTDSALELLPGDHASVRLLDDSRTELLSGARSGSGLDSTPPSFRLGEGIVGWVVENGALAHVDDTHIDPRFEARPEQGFEVRTVVAVPLWAAGQVVGVLSISGPTAGGFDDRDVLLARLLANCASPAFDKARLERLAVTDTNTRAFNRRYLMPRLEREIAFARTSGATFSVLMMDLDHFKAVNDVYGHNVGDEVLLEFADRVREATRKVDELVRWGGEEFVLVMPGADLASAEAVAERIRGQIADHPFWPSGAAEELIQTVSIGVATWDGGEGPEQLENRADAAMYRAKRNGRNQVHR